jgi:hypothetical protein
MESAITSEVIRVAGMALGGPGASGLQNFTGIDYGSFATTAPEGVNHDG